MLKSLFSLTFFCSSIIFSAEKIGDPAPILEGIEIVKIPEDLKQSKDKVCQEFAKNNQVIFKKNKVYVIEFWGVRCVPCIRLMPHLSELQKKYGDQVIILGVARVDKSQTREEIINLAKNPKYKMNYRVAIDTKGTAYNQLYFSMNARGLPTAFLIDKKGKVAWMGHPGLLDEPLENAINTPDEKENETSAQPTIKTSNKK